MIKTTMLLFAQCLLKGAQSSDRSVISSIFALESAPAGSPLVAEKP